MLARLKPENIALAAEIAAIPEQIRGYGHVKEANVHKAEAKQAELMAKWNAA
jgi:indolepyruvate ferredoxin oxidoreductase